MIVVHTSALLAVALDEPEADDCEKILNGEPRLLISAATVAEALIVAGRWQVAKGVLALLAGLPFETVSVRMHLRGGRPPPTSAGEKACTRPV